MSAPEANDVIPAVAAEQGQVNVRLPLQKPRVVYVFLALIGLVFVAELALGGSQNQETLRRLGAQVNPLVAVGELWRLVAAMFLHIGLQHILFNGWALFSVGREVEAMYGSAWFVVIYFAAGLAGNIGYYWLGDSILSAGASGAVFGLIGAEAAFFLINRPLFGKLGSQRLGNLGVLIAINLVFGFTVPGINNIAHLGGLIMGFGLGLLLAPRFAVEWRWDMAGAQGHVADRQPAIVRLAGTLVAVALLLGVWQLGNARWQNNAETFRTQAYDALSAGDRDAARQLFEQAVAADSQDAVSLANLGLMQLQDNQLAQGVTLLERAYALTPDNPDVQFFLAAGYVETDRLAEAKPLMERFLQAEEAGERADYAREVLAR
jgi:rhomboid protease GluP